MVQVSSLTLRGKEIEITNGSKILGKDKNMENIFLPELLEFKIGKCDAIKQNESELE